jgi:nucleoside-diphosphate-sugar epimerase
MTTVAVIGSSSPVGLALLERLDTDSAVSRLIGVDCDEPGMPVARLEFRVAEVRDRLLALALSDAEVVVHLGIDDDPDLDDDTRFARNVNGTRNVLDAVVKVGAKRLVLLSGALAYGAHSDNALPLAEDAPLRANPDYPTAYHLLLAEGLVAEFAEAHPRTRVVVLRPATVLGPGVDSVAARHLLAPRLLTVAGHEPPLQLVSVDDLASALQLACTGDLTGVYNVAADGWLAHAEVGTVLGRRRLAVPETVLYSLARARWARQVASVHPGVLHFLMHPTVVTASRIKAAGWQPTRSNRETLREFAATHHGELQLGRQRVRSRDLVIAGCAAVGALIGLWAGGRSRRAAARRA